jgi:vesicle coat complex subunit
MPQREDFSRRRSPPDLIRALGRLARDDSESLASSVLPLLAHAEPDVRSEALSAVFVLWRLDEHREQAKRMLEADRHAEVRARAAYAIAATSNEQTRRTDALLLLNKIESPNEDAEVRRAAYEALMLLFGRGDLPDAVKDFVPEEQIDWAWLSELRSMLA